VVFGQRWADAGSVVQILSPGILLEFVAFPLSVFFLVTNTQFYAFAIQSVGFVLMLAALTVGKLSTNDFLSTCYLIALVMVLVNAAGILLGRRVAARPRGERPVDVVPAPELPDRAASLL
jgi:hypothetical protein